MRKAGQYDFILTQKIGALFSRILKVGLAMKPWLVRSRCRATRANLSEHKVEDVGEGVVGHDARAADDVHISADCVAHAQRSLCRLAHMQNIACSHL